MRVPYIPVQSHVWEEFLAAQQHGAGLPGYGGAPYQRGAGLGSFFRGLFKMAVPLLKRAAKVVGKEALKTGVSVIGDVVRGGELLPSLETHGREAAGNLADRAKEFLGQEGGGTGGGGPHRRRRRRRRVIGKKQKLKKRKPKKAQKTVVKKRKSIKGKRAIKKRPRRIADIFDDDHV